MSQESTPHGSGRTPPPEPGRTIPPEGSGQTPPPAGFGPPQAQADAPWQRTDGMAAPAPAPSGGWVAGGVTFAGVLMLCNGVLAALMGISAIAKDDVYSKVGDYVYEFSVTGWGWLHLILGICVAVTGWGLLSRKPWARYTGIFFASLSLVAQFMFLPYSPFWSMIMMAVDLFVIWALAAYEPKASRKRTAAA